ncbi:DUF2796 domain-containing protein [Magnetococcales bacterium HHB-1]
MKIKILSIVSSLFIAAQGLVSIGLSESFYDHKPHVHGIGELHIATEGRTLSIEWESPSMNIIGFEHTPQTDQEKQSLNRAIQNLKRASSLFKLPSEAACQIKKVEINSELLPKHHAASHDKNHQHEKHGHEHKETDHHDAHHADHHADHHDHHADHKADQAHSDFHMTYLFDCKNPDELSSINVQIFKYFPTTNRLNVHYAIAHGQGATKLTIKNSRLKF